MQWKFIVLLVEVYLDFQLYSFDFIPHVGFDLGLRVFSVIDFLSGFPKVHSNAIMRDTEEPFAMKHSLDRISEGYLFSMFFFGVF